MLMIIPLVLVLVLRTAAAACTTDRECSLLGSCVSGSCACDAGWLGDDCATLDLLPPAPTGSYIAPDDYSSWGMSVVKDKGGDYPRFVSEFLNGDRAVAPGGRGAAGLGAQPEAGLLAAG